MTDAYIISKMNEYMFQLSEKMGDWLSNTLPRITNNWWDDLVMNHSSIANEWFKTARDYLAELPDDKEPDASECKYVDYYTFVKGETAGNYYKAGKSNYYYEGQFSQQMPDINLDNPDVRAEFEQIAKFFVLKGFRG